MSMINLPVINSHNSWSQLEEVWLGDVYPAAWYNELPADVRDIFWQLTEITQQDLSAIQKVLETFGITVQRPHYNRIEDFLKDGNLIKPEICPRDNFIVVGNQLLCTPDSVTAWQPILEQYRTDPRSTVSFGADKNVFNGANVVRVGRDIIIDQDVHEWDRRFDWPEYRIHLERNGGHMDGCFAVLKPGLILANHYYDGYEKSFPGWEIIYLDNPTYGAAPSTGYKQPYPVYNSKFFDTTVGTNRMFNNHIVKHAQDWVGNYTETYFELNCLVINEKNVVMLAHNEQLANTLAQHDITVHWVPFRTRSFWDGAMHCLTVDIRRRSTIEDFFPERN